MILVFGFWIFRLGRINVNNRAKRGWLAFNVTMVASGLALLPALSQAASQGADITIGGFGSEPGKFVGLVDPET